MRVHYIDALVLILALLGVVTVTFLGFDSLSMAARISDSGVTCWAPNHFTGNMVDYTNKICTHAWRAGRTYYLPFHERIPRRDEDHKKKFVDPEETGSGNRSDVTLKSLLLAEMIIAVLSFVVLQMIVTILFTKAAKIDQLENTSSVVEDDPKRVASAMENQDFINRKRRDTKSISSSSRVTIIYCVILLAAAVAWFVLGAISHGLSADKDGNVAACKNCTDDVTGDVQEKGTDVFMCDFEVRQIGNVQQYTVQCTKNPKAGFGSGPIASQVNTAVCFTIASLRILHLLYTLVLAPLVNGLGGKNGFISDANLAMTVGAL